MFCFVVSFVDSVFGCFSPKQYNSKTENREMVMEKINKQNRSLAQVCKST